ncbi:apolipoprotein N-acyltransferase [Orbaceae bacterium ESL0727]|nr:apolipoprotein N-acyltransferase [Orbaceae bacterium ESL0727]
MLKQVLLSLLLGGCAVFSYAPFHIWPLALISFAGLLWLIADKNQKQATLLSFTWAIAYFAAGIHWVYISIRQYGDLPTMLAVLILIGLICYLALYPLLFAFLLRAIKRLAPAFSFMQLVIAAPLIWQITEFLRGYIMNGFAWLQLGYSGLDSPLRNYFPLFGIDGVNLIITCLAGLLVYLLHDIKRYFATQRSNNIALTGRLKHKISAFFALILLFFAPLLFSHTHWTKRDSQRSANFTLIQGNIAQSLRWSSQQLDNTLTTYLALTEANFDRSDIIIWSEATITDYELNQQPFLADLDNEARANNVSVAVGLIDYRPSQQRNQPGNIYNTLLVLGENAPYVYPSTNRYQKHHLVPFGEFTPLETVLKPIATLLDIPMSSMQAGEAKQPPLIMKNFKFTTAICYEVILSSLIWQNFQPDTDFLLTVSNDAWFGDSIGPLQHLQMAQARALEFGRPLIRSTNNGVTAIINENGTIIQQLPQFETAVLTATLSPTTGLTPYAIWGNKPYFIALGLMLLLLLLNCTRRLVKKTA